MHEQLPQKSLRAAKPFLLRRHADIGKTAALLVHFVAGNLHHRIVSFFQRLRQLFIDIRIHIVVAVHKAEIIAGGQINTHIAGGGSPAVFFMMLPDSVILIRQPLTELIRTVR